MRTVLVLLTGLALGIGGTLGVRATTDQSDSNAHASKANFRSEVRQSLAEEWGDTYAQRIKAVAWDRIRLLSSGRNPSSGAAVAIVRLPGAGERFDHPGA
jgi:hypothetical protein